MNLNTNPLTRELSLSVSKDGETFKNITLQMADTAQDISNKVF
jgi:hypothetical protein